MNILIVALDFKPLSGGIAEYTHQIATHLQLAGDSVVVLSREMKGGRKFDETVSYKVSRYNHDACVGRISQQYRTYKEIKKVSQEQSVEIVISNSLGSEAHICWLVSRVLCVPYVLLAYGTEINTKHNIAGEAKKKWSLRGADKVFCISSFTQELVCKLGVSRDRTAIIHPGLPNRFVEEARKTPNRESKKNLGLDGKKVIFTLGRLVERKGIDNVIKSLVYVRKKIPNAVYIVAGDGPYKKNLEEITKEEGLSDKVIFTGFLSESEKHRYYEAADVFVMPCKELKNGDVEGFGIVYLEAGSHSKPIVAGRSGGVSDAVIDGKTGILVDPFNVENIASATIELLTNAQLAQKMGTNGRLHVEGNFLWNKTVPRLRRDLHNLL